MANETVQTARLMKVVDAVVEELERQGVAEVMADRKFDVEAMALAVIKAADGDVVPFRRPEG